MRDLVKDYLNNITDEVDDFEIDFLEKPEPEDQKEEEDECP
jgi:hypothetical protein